MITTMPEAKLYHMKGGGTISGATPEEVVAALRASSYHPCATVEDFMEETSLACRTYDHNAIISTYNAEEFVIDLCANGFLIDAANPPNILPFNPEE